jgi:hypothetical protein
MKRVNRPNGGHERPGGNVAALTAMAATTTIPIVFAINGSVCAVGRRLKLNLTRVSVRTVALRHPQVQRYDPLQPGQARVLARRRHFPAWPVVPGL